MAMIAPLLHGADVAFTNLEGTIYGRHGGWPMKQPLFHAGPPGVLDDLQALGFNALSLVNNHSFDLGPGGVLSTIEEADARGLLHAGLGADRKSAGRRSTRELRNGRKIALDRKSVV